MKLGFYLGRSNEKTIWLHGVSLGEIKILTPLAKRLSQQGKQSSGQFNHKYWKGRT